MRSYQFLYEEDKKVGVILEDYSWYYFLLIKVFKASIWQFILPLKVYNWSIQKIADLIYKRIRKNPKTQIVKIDLAEPQDILRLDVDKG